MADGDGIPLSELFAEPVVTDSHEDAVVRLHDSLRAGDVPRVEEAIAVLRQRAIPLTVCAQDGRSAALVTAAFPTAHSGEIMHILIREGVFQDRMGHAVETLFCAARHDNPAVIEPLLSLGIPVEALERRPAANIFNSLLGVAAGWGSVDYCQELVTRGANPNGGTAEAGGGLPKVPPLAAVTFPSLVRLPRMGDPGHNPKRATCTLVLLRAGANPCERLPQRICDELPASIGGSGDRVEAMQLQFLEFDEPTADTEELFALVARMRTWERRRRVILFRSAYRHRTPVVPGPW